MEFIYFVARVPESDIENSHVVANLPDETEKINESLLKDLPITAITDKRGSLLYLQGKELLTHLEQLFSLAQPRTVIYLSKGISRWLYVDLVLRKKENNSLEIVDCIPGLRTRRFPSYIHDVAYTALYWEGPRLWGRANMEWLLTNILGIDIKGVMEEYYSPNPCDAISEAIAYIAFKKELRGNKIGFMRAASSPESRIAKEFFTTLISEGIEKAQSYLQETKKRRKGVYPRERMIITLLEYFDLEKLHQLIARIAGQSRLTTARQGILFPDQALKGLAPFLNKYL